MESGSRQATRPKEVTGEAPQQRPHLPASPQAPRRADRAARPDRRPPPRRRVAARERPAKWYSRLASRRRRRPLRPLLRAGAHPAPYGARPRGGNRRPPAAAHDRGRDRLRARDAALDSLRRPPAQRARPSLRPCTRRSRPTATSALAREASCTSTPNSSAASRGLPPRLRSGLERGWQRRAFRLAWEHLHGRPPLRWTAGGYAAYFIFS